MPTKFKEAMERLKTPGLTPTTKTIEKKGLINKVCVRCAGFFKTWNIRKKYCSPECQVTFNNVHYRNQKKEGIKKRCLFCGNTFETTKGGQKFCPGSPISLCQQTYQYHKTPYSKLRMKILSRDNFTCQYCGAQVEDARAFEIDHIRPKSKGGSDEEYNLITACEGCNQGKGDLHIGEVNIKKFQDIARRNETRKQSFRM